MRLIFVAAVTAAMSTHAQAEDLLIRCRFPDPKHVGGFTPMTWLLSRDTLYQGRQKPSEKSPKITLVVLSREGDVLRADWSTASSKARLQVDLKTGEATENLMDRGPRRGICIATDPADSSSDDEN